jgi:hypothetical protein
VLLLQVIDTTRRPGIKFTYHISPMSVIVTESRMPFYHFLTNVRVWLAAWPLHVPSVFLAPL